MKHKLQDKMYSSIRWITFNPRLMEPKFSIPKAHILKRIDLSHIITYFLKVRSNII